METYQQCILELALRFFAIEGDSRLTESHLQHFDWCQNRCQSGSTSDLLINGNDAERSCLPIRRIITISKFLTFRICFCSFCCLLLVVDCYVATILVQYFPFCFFVFFLYRMNPGFARYRNHFDLPSARFLWFSESGVNISFPEDPIWPDEELEFPPMNRLHLGD